MVRFSLNPWKTMTYWRNRHEIEIREMLHKDMQEVKDIKKLQSHIELLNAIISPLLDVTYITGRFIVPESGPPALETNEDLKQLNGLLNELERLHSKLNDLRNRLESRVKIRDKAGLKDKVEFARRRGFRAPPLTKRSFFELEHMAKDDLELIKGSIDYLDQAIPRFRESKHLWENPEGFSPGTLQIGKDLVKAHGKCLKNLKKCRSDLRRLLSDEHFIRFVEKHIIREYDKCFPK